MSVRTRLINGVVFLEIDDGKVNAMSRDLLEAISRALAEARAKEAIVVISGRPGIFSAGFDMKTFAEGPEASAAMVQAGIDTILAILEHPRPVITCATGHAFPMGAFLMLAADTRIGLDGDFTIGMNETAIKIDVPDFAVALARSRLTPPAYARIRTAQMFSPQEAIEAGYLDFVAAPNELPELLDKHVANALSLDSSAFRSTKRRMNERVVAEIKSAGVPERLLT
jgi:enoyl-CoA hydratase